MATRLTSSMARPARIMLIACSVSLAATTAACVRAGEPGDCNDQNSLLEAVLRHQFENNASSIGDQAKTYFISLPDGKDPDEQFLSRFDAHLPPVKAASESGRDGNRVIDRVHGEPALIFSVRSLRTTPSNGVLIEAGYYEADLSASWTSLMGLCKDERWVVRRYGPEKLS
jgi:hypothetical protein